MYQLNTKPNKSIIKDVLFIIVVFILAAYFIESTLDIIDKDVCSKVNSVRFTELGCEKVMK